MAASVAPELQPGGFRIRTPLRLLPSGLCLLLWLFAGCKILPEAQSDPTKVYVLSSAAAAAATAPANPDQPAPAIRLRAIEVASYLRARPMIVRKGDNELEFREFARWGEPLEQGIARVLREELLASGAVSQVQLGAMRPSEANPARFDVNVRVLAAEGASDGRVLFTAAWDITTLAEPQVVARGVYRGADLAWKSKDEATLAAALSRGVAGLAQEIAGAVGGKR